VGVQLGIAVVTRQTRLEGLKARFATAGQAKFYVQQAAKAEALRQLQAAPVMAADEQSSAPARRGRQSLGARAAAAARELKLAEAVAERAFDDYDAEDSAYDEAVQSLLRELDFGLPIKQVDRAFVPNFSFFTAAVVVVVGQDGLVANTAKYVGDLPIVAVNPDPQRIDGVLLPFQVHEARRAVSRALENRAKVREVTLAEVQLNDGQRLLAFNDFFLGAASHVSARYRLRVADREEPQSSSGVLVSTGAGSTGWLSSVFNMAQGIATLGQRDPAEPVRLSWEDRRLMWVVREPFASKHSQAGLVAGLLEEPGELVVESQMPEGGVIFSDGVEADALQFNSGSIARVFASRQRARLVVG
jgi:hypothetical protein